MFKHTLFVAFLVFGFAFSAIAQDIDSGGDSLMRSGRTVTVPSVEYPTIESALYQGLEIVLLPGVYYGNFPIFASESIRAKQAGTVTVHSADAFQNTFALYDSASLKLKNITVVGTQQLTFYYTAAVYGWGNVSMEIDNCEIVSSSIGLSASYPKLLTVTNSKFIGTAPEAIGIYTSFNQSLGKFQGARIYDNEFQSLNIGMHIRDYTGTEVTPVSLCRKTRNCTDSNYYDDVATPIYQDQAPF